MKSENAAYALLLGALLTLPIEYLFLQTHGPYEAALNRLVWGLNHHDYSRWAVFPSLLVLPGIRAFHLWQRDSYGNAGLWGYRLYFSGAALATIGQIWDYTLFDPWEHPLHGVGFFAQLLAILLIFIGLPLWAFAVFRARKIIRWQAAIPVLWVLYLVNLFIHIFTSDENWLYPRFGIDGGMIANIFMSIAYVLMGFTLLIKIRTSKIE